MQSITLCLPKNRGEYMATDNKHERVQLSFVKNNKEHMEVFEKLECLGKQKTKFVVMALQDFMATYNLMDKSEDDIRKFIELYPYLSAIKNKSSFMNMDLSSIPMDMRDKKNPSSPKKEKETLSSGPKLTDTAKSSMNNLLAKFNG